jgi:hypothetical protein
MFELRDIEKHRSKRSQTIDERKVNAKVIPTDSPLTEQWAEHPGRLDVAGIDAPAKTPITIKTEGGHYQKIGGIWRFKKDATLHKTKLAQHSPKLLHQVRLSNPAQPKGMPKPALSMKRQGKVIHIKDVGLARKVPRGRISKKK